MILAAPWLKPALLAGALGASFIAGWQVNGWRLGKDEATERVRTVEVVRYIERETQQVADTEGEAGHAEIEQARRDADAARSTAAGLRAEAGRIATRLATCNAGTAAERTARANTAELLANVLADVESEGRAMAEVATRARAAGLTCERVYDGVRAGVK